jgi:hypothetical protein
MFIPLGTAPRRNAHLHHGLALANMYMHAVCTRLLIAGDTTSARYRRLPWPTFEIANAPLIDSTCVCIFRVFLMEFQELSLLIPCIAPLWRQVICHIKFAHTSHLALVQRLLQYTMLVLSKFAFPSPPISLDLAYPVCTWAILYNRPKNSGLY